MKRTKTRKLKAADWKPLLLLGLVVIVINATAFYFAYRRPSTQPAVRRIPHYFATAEMAKPLPQTLEPTGFSNRDAVAAYRAAKEIPKVLAPTALLLPLRPQYGASQPAGLLCR